MQTQAGVDSSSGFCTTTGIYYSKRPSVPLPQDRHLTLPAFLFSKPHFEHSTKLAYIDSSTGASLSYIQVRDHVYSVAAGLSRTFGVKPGDVVLLISPNSVSLPLVVLATMAVGAVITTANPLNQTPEISKQIHDSGAKFVACIPSLLHKLPSPKLPVILLPEPGAASSTEALITDAAIKLGFPRSITYSKLLLSSPQGFCFHKGLQEDIAALMYSSGTTGTSKGVILTHRNFIAYICTRFEGGDLRRLKHNVYLCTIPMFHIYGMMFSCLGTLYTQATIVLQGRFNVRDTLESVQKYKVTHLPAVPPILLALAKFPDVEKFDTSSLSRVTCGAAALAKEIMDSFRARFPHVSLVQGYGLTETAAVLSFLFDGDENPFPQSSGLLQSNSELKIIDIESGLALPPNMRGEIWFRGPCVMKGYFGKPSETAATIDEHGWLHTGDIGYVNSEGYLFIVDRLKELIKYKGLQVAPAELEEVLMSHPNIIDAAVVPYPDKEAGQVPMGFVVRGNGSSLTEQEVINFVAKQVAPYKKVRRVAFVSSIPKSASGKILRRELVNMLTCRL